MIAFYSDSVISLDRMISKMNNRFQETKVHPKDEIPVIKLNNIITPEPSKKESALEKLGTFCGYTTAHGFGRLQESKGWIRKGFWSVACLCAFFMFGFQVMRLAKEYMRKPVETYISVQHVRDMDFPVVTICNHNIIRFSKISSNDSTKLGQYFQDFMQKDSNNTIEGTSSTESTEKGRVKRDRNSKKRKKGKSKSNTTDVSPTTTTATFTAHALTTPSLSSSSKKEKRRNEKKASKLADLKTSSTRKNKKTEEEDGKITDYVTRQERLHVTLATWSEEALSQLGHQFDDMARDCTFKGRSCMRDKVWSSFWHYKYGNCFSFNGRTEKPLKAGGAGPDNGLLLELNVEQNEYIGDLTKDVGIRVLIGNPGQVPFPYVKGFSIGPGAATSIGMRKVKIQRADPFKNGSCLGKNGLGRNNLYRLKYNASYSTTACKESCLSDKQMKFCGCREYRFPKDETKNESVCDVLNSTVVDCLNGVMKKYRKGNMGCSRKCPSVCSEDVFKLTISTSKFPSLAYERFMKIESMKKLRKAKKLPEDIRSNLLQLNVFFEELNYEVIEEKIGYELLNFMSDIGGNMGMWIGVSVLTCAELLELLCIIFHHLVKNCFRGSKIKELKY